MKIIFRWYDIWVGFFWDKKKRLLYFFPIPCIGFVFTFENTRVRIQKRLMANMKEFFALSREEMQGHRGKYLHRQIGLDTQTLNRMDSRITRSRKSSQYGNYPVQAHTNYIGKRAVWGNYLSPNKNPIGVITEHRKDADSAMFDIITIDTGYTGHRQYFAVEGIDDGFESLYKQYTTC